MLPHNSITMELPLGTFVQARGLKKSPIYNGIAGLIVEPKNAEERYGVQLLDHAEGWKEESPNAKLAVGGKILAVKETNLKKTNRDSKHWRIAVSGDISILEQIRADPNLANLNRCDELARGIWNLFFETIPGMPLTLDHGFEMRKEIVKDSKGHTIYWLEMDAIQHQFIIEKCRGRYRVFQAFVDDTPVMPGYTAEAWCGMEYEQLLSTKVHKIYGGGRTAGDAEIDQLLDYIKNLQSVSSKLMPHLLKSVPNLDQSSIDLICGGPQRLSPEEVDLAQEKMQVAISWSNKIELQTESLGLTTLNVVFHPEVGILGDSVLIAQDGVEILQIPKRLYLRVQDLNYKLTGQTILSPLTFVRMINSGLWWEHRRDTDGGGVGFTIRAASLDQVQSYEEGLAAAAEKTARVQSTLTS